jgi:hypothetical protein
MTEPKVLVASGRAGLTANRNHYAEPLLLMLATVAQVSTHKPRPCN